MAEADKAKKVQKAAKANLSKSEEKTKMKKEPKKKQVEEDDEEGEENEVQDHDTRSNKKAKLSNGKQKVHKVVSDGESKGSKESPVSDDVNKKTKKRKHEETEDGGAKLKVKEADGNSPLSNFNICKETVDKLLATGITCLFPIQAATFNHIYNGKDLIAKARTGTGKTLAFALPVHEKMLALKAAGSITDKRGRSPACIVMAPTRELAKQVVTPRSAECSMISTHDIYDLQTLQCSTDWPTLSCSKYLHYLDKHE